MSSYIGTNENGFLTYTNEPDIEQTYLKNINDTYPETELNEITETLTAITTALSSINDTLTIEDVSEKYTFEGGLVTTFSLLSAVKIANILYMTGTVTPTRTLVNNEMTTITFSGFVPELPINSKVGFGFNLSNYYGVLLTTLSNETVLRVRKVGTANWETSESVTITVAIPITEPEPEPEPDENNEGE